MALDLGMLLGAPKASPGRPRLIVSGDEVEAKCSLGLFLDHQPRRRPVQDRVAFQQRRRLRFGRGRTVGAMCINDQSMDAMIDQWAYC